MSEIFRLFERGLEFLFDEAAVIGVRDCLTAEALTFLKVNTSLGV